MPAPGIDISHGAVARGGQIQSIHQEDVGVCVLVISLVTLSPVHSHAVDVDAQLAFRRHVQE